MQAEQGGGQRSNAAMRNHNATVREGYVEVNGARLFYVRAGPADAEKIIFIHGWTEDHTVWSSQIKHFSKSYDVVAYDQRGHGASEKPHDASLRVLKDDLRALIESFGFEKVILVGHSMGGMVALLFTLQHPERVTRLVLAGTSAKPLDTLFRRVFAAVLGFFVKHAFTLVAYLATRRAFYRADRRMKRAAFERARRTSSTTAHRLLTEIARLDLRAELPKITQRTLVIVGEKDRTTPVRMSRLLAERIENAELHVIPEAKHVVMMDQPERFNAALEAFLHAAGSEP